MAQLTVKINGVQITVNGVADTVEVLHELENAGTAYHFDTSQTAKVYVYDGTEEVGDETIDLTEQWERIAE